MATLLDHGDRINLSQLDICVLAVIQDDQLLAYNIQQRCTELLERDIPISYSAIRHSLAGLVTIGALETAMLTSQRKLPFTGYSRTSFGQDLLKGEMRLLQRIIDIAA